MARQIEVYIIFLPAARGGRRLASSFDHSIIVISESDAVTHCPRMDTEPATELFFSHPFGRNLSDHPEKQVEDSKGDSDGGVNDVDDHEQISQSQPNQSHRATFL